MVEQEAVNFEVAGSSPASGANEKTSVIRLAFFHRHRRCQIRTG